MPNLNKVMLMGNLTRDPEVKHTPKGTAVCQFGLAISRTYSNNGEKKEEVTFVDVEAWGRTAEVIGEYCRKGKPLFVEGRLKLDQWDDKESGQKRSKLKVVADNIQLLGGKQEQQEPPQQPSRSIPKPPADPDLDVQPDDVPF